MALNDMQAGFLFSNPTIIEQNSLSQPVINHYTQLQPVTIFYSTLHSVTVCHKLRQPVMDSHWHWQIVAVQHSATVCYSL